MLYTHHQNVSTLHTTTSEIYYNNYCARYTVKLSKYFYINTTSVHVIKRREHNHFACAASQMYKRVSYVEVAYHLVEWAYGNPFHLGECCLIKNSKHSCARKDKCKLSQLNVHYMIVNTITFVGLF